MVKNIILFLFLFGLCFSFYRCDNKEKIPELVEFGVSIKLEGELLREIPIYTTRNVHMMVLDTFLIVQTREEKFFKIYSTRSYQLLGEFGKEGDGPSDFRFPHLSKEIWDSQKSPSINQIYDHRLNRQYTVSIPEILEGETFEGKTLGRINSYVKHFYFKNEDYLWSTIDGPGRFFHIDYKNDRTKVIPYIPKTDFHIEDEEDLSIVYRSSVIANEQKGLVAAAPYLLGQIDFFDMQGNYIRSTHFEQSQGLSEALAIRKVNPNLFDTKVFISDMDASEEFIYGLSRNNLGKNIRDPQIRSPHKILVFDWEGNPVKEYVLNDKRYVFSMAIDERNKRIYAYCPEEEEYNLVVYNYP